MNRTDGVQSRRLVIGLAAGVGVLLLVVGVLAGALLSKRGGSDSDVTSVASRSDESSDPIVATPTTVATYASTPSTQRPPSPQPTNSASYRPPATTAGLPCPSGTVDARIDSATIYEHSEGSEYYDYNFTATVTNNKSAPIDWYYVKLWVNGDEHNDRLIKDEGYNSASVRLQPGQSWTFTDNEVPIDSPSGTPTFTIGKISWLWVNGGKYPPDCRANA